MDIGNKLKELRVLKGLTQEELADRSELSKGFISQLERNLTSPSITTLMDILQCLGTSIGEFFNETPEEQIVFGKTDYFEKHDLHIHIPEGAVPKDGRLQALPWLRLCCPLLQDKR